MTKFSGGKNVFLADDDEDDRDLFEEALSELTDNVILTKATNGKQLMSILEETVPPKPDLIFLDLNMPIKNGFECLAEIRGSEKFRNIPVVIFSTSCEKEFIDRVYQEGADYYICKPVNFSHLKNAISSALSINWDNYPGQPPREHFLLS